MSEFAYHEPGMKNVGIMSGVGISFSKYVGKVYWNTDMGLEAGRVKYTSVDTGAVNNNANLSFEARVVAGMNLGKAITGEETTWTFVPYGGLAYRFLDNDTEGKTSSTGYSGYDRRSNYIYSPVGMKVTKQFAKGWSISSQAEYDLFWLGTQFSYISPTITNHQTSGYGLRGSVELRYKGKERDFVIEPFITYWSIGISNTETLLTTSGKYVFWEPANTTTEIGCKIGFSF
jgi:hypothetical protein